MPPLPPVPNVLKVEIKGTYTSGYDWANVLHFTYGGGAPTSGDCASIASTVWGEYNSEFIPSTVPQQSLELVVVTDLASSTAATGEYVQHQVGTSSADKLPGNVCVLVSKYVPVRYRGGHPRTYLAIGADENLQDQGHWNSSFVTNTLTNWTNFIDGIIGTVAGTTAVGQECAVSYYTTDYSTTPPSRVRRVAPVVYDIPVDGYSIQAEIASQRRRIGRKR